jgi:hypothetical protein
MHVGILRALPDKGGAFEAFPHQVLASVQSRMLEANDLPPAVARQADAVAGSNLNEWVTRIATLNKRTFYLFDREQEPETSIRKEIVEAVNKRIGCHAVLTSKRAVENYLHPVAILEACNIDLAFDDDTDVASLLALKMMERNGELSWHQLSSKRQRRLHEKAKKMLNVKVVQRMTPALLAERDLEGEVESWLQSIRRLIEIDSGTDHTS